jgi:hypothetical protein
MVRVLTNHGKGIVAMLGYSYFVVLSQLCVTKESLLLFVAL